MQTFYRVLLLGLLCVGTSTQAATGIGVRMGFPVFPIPGGGADVFYSSTHWTLGANYSSGSLDYGGAANADDPSYHAQVEQALVKSSLALIEFRYFLFWGFHISVGVGQRQMAMNYRVADPTANDAVQGSVKTTSNLMHAGIGIMGRWDTYFAGFDILGISRPSSSRVKVNSHTDGIATAEVAQLDADLQKAGQAIGSASSAQILMLTIGALM